MTQDALVFGGDILTASDIAVASGLANIGSTKPSEDRLPAKLVTDACAKMHDMLEEVIDKVKVRCSQKYFIIIFFLIIIVL